MNIDNYRIVSPDGTIYNQIVTMEFYEFVELHDKIIREICSDYKKHECYAPDYITANSYLKNLPLNKNIVFLTSVQRRFIDMFIPLNLKVKNTAIIVGSREVQK